MTTSVANHDDVNAINLKSPKSQMLILFPYFDLQY